MADAKQAAGDEKDPWRVAVALERFVNREVKKKDFTQAFASAAEVAKTREGDCTEHAVFLAALARARGIPARVAIGLVYLEGEQAFLLPHVDGGVRRQAVDSDRRHAGPRRHRRRPSEDRPDQPRRGLGLYAPFCRWSQVAGRLKIEIVDAQ